MFYPPPQFDQFQQEQQQRKELELLYKQQQQLQSILLSTPPPSPMSATLGHPNRSCVSCKKRKVKCDRKTPSCTACQKSKHKCQYTSYAPPPVYTEDSQNNDEGFKTMKQKIEELDIVTRQRWEHFQKLMASVPKDGQGYANNPSAPYYNNITDDELVYNLNLNNSVIPTSTGSQYTLQQQQGSPQQYQIAQQQQPQQQEYLYPPQQQYQSSSAQTSPYIQTNLVVPSGNYSPYMSGTIVLNYNLNGMRSFLGRQVVPILQQMTGGQGPAIPSTGFSDLNQLQEWLREKFLNQEWIEEMETSYNVVDPDERFVLRPVYEEINQQNQFIVRQKFEVILHRVDFASSPSSVHGDFHYDYEDKHNMDHMENLTVYSETGSNRSSVADLDPSEVFLNKIYDFVRKFIRNLPWLRENFLANWRTRSPLEPVPFNDGVFSDVVVEVRKLSSYSPYQDLKLIQTNPQEDFIKGRLGFF